MCFSRLRSSLMASWRHLQSSRSIALLVLLPLAAHFLSALTPASLLSVDLRLPAPWKGVAPKLRRTKCLSADRPSEGARAMENPS